MNSGLIGGIVAALLLALVAWFANQRKPGAPLGTAVYYGVAMKAIAVACCAGFIAFTAFAYMANLDGNPTAPTWVILFFWAFAGAGFVMVVDVFTRRIDWTQDGLVFRSWRGVHKKRWSDIVSFDERPLMQYERVCFRDGSGFATFSYLSGRLDFLTELAERDIPFTRQGREIIFDDPDQPPDP